MSINIRNMISEDWDAVSRIYEEGISTGMATFQITVPTYEEWDKGHVKSCRRVAVNEQNEILGWVALSAVSGRCVYAGVAEVSVYVGTQYRKLGIGHQLLQDVILESEEQGFWMLQSGIFRDNVGSIALHEKAGFRMVGYREKIGQTVQGEWKDTVLMERRSERVGM